ncbi:unnamed protein product, partial [marine sediment metagenome]
LITLLPYNNEPPTALYSTFDTRNQHPLLDHALTEISIFTAIMPRSYAGGGVTVYLHYAMETAVANDIRLDTEFERIGDQQQDIDADSFAAPQNTGDITVPGTSGLVDIVSTTHTDGGQMDSVAVGESFRLRVERVAVAGTDAADDLEMVAIEIVES